MLGGHRSAERFDGGCRQPYGVTGLVEAIGGIILASRSVSQVAMGDVHMTDVSNNKIRVHLADGDYLIRLGIERAVEQCSYVELEAVSRTGEEAVAAAVNLQPDIVLMETDLGGVDGIAAVSEISSRAPATKVVMLASAADRDTMMRAYSAGAVSYLIKNGLTEDLGPALRMIHRGATILVMPPGSPRLQRPSAHRALACKKVEQLPLRDRKLLAGVTAGHTNAQLGKELHLSEATVKAQLSALMQHFKVTNRVQLAVLGSRAGVLDRTDAPPA